MTSLVLRTSFRFFSVLLLTPKVPTPETTGEDKYQGDGYYYHLSMTLFGTLLEPTPWTQTPTGLERTK